jgi:hypothetical protein
MNTATWDPSRRRALWADAALRAGARSWFVVAVAGQLAFAFAVASFYGLAAARGKLSTWNTTLAQGWTEGDPVGNGVLAAHLLLAVFIQLGGMFQLLPGVRAHAPVLHRWNGRAYVLFAFAMGATGLYLTMSGRHVVGDAAQHLAVQMNAVMILACAAMAWRHALARDFAAHRRWALRLFLVVGGVWFFRLGMMSWLLVNGGPVGFDPATLEGPFITALAFGQTLVPLAVLELYLRAQHHPRGAVRMTMAGGLLALAALTGAGVVAATLGLWLPRIEQAYDPRVSIADTLWDTLGARGIDAALDQYRTIRSADHAGYKFEERELNELGYHLIGAKRYAEAIRILQLNVQAYPASANVYDSLAEAYLDAGRRTEALANYQVALERDPRNRHAAALVTELKGP